MTNKLGQLGRFCFLLCFLLSMRWPLAAAPGAAPILVREALEDRDKNAIPDLLGEAVRLQGVLISDPTLSKDSRASAAYLQDGSGGIRLQAADNTLVTTGLGRGDIVQVQGVMQQAQGRTELKIEQIRRIGHGNVPPPRKVRVAELLRGQYLGELVELQGQLLVPPDLEGKTEGFQLRDESGRIRILARSRFFHNGEFAERLRKGGNVALVGIVERHTLASASRPGYSVHPRDSADFHFPPVLPYQTMAMVGALVSLLWVLVHFYLRRRAAERQAREVASWSENLQRSEAALRESNQRLSTLVRSSPLAIVALDMQSKVQAWNPAAERMFGWTEQEVLGRDIPTVSQWVQPVYRTHAERVPTDEVLLAKDVQAERKDGTLFIARISLSPLYNGDSQIHGCMAVIEDITVQKRAEEALRESNQRFSTLFRSSPLAIIGLDRQRNVQAWNPAAEQMFGWSEQEVLGKPLPNVPEENQQKYRGIQQRLVNGEVLGSEEVRPLRKDGSQFFAKLFIAPLYDSEGRVSGSIAVLNDITVQKRAEEELRASEAKYRSLITTIPDVTWTAD